ncbi:hypothetical protein SAMD00019534_080380 [Acytostelium subglobosum LB1]|uniref:hypothetical protein n=1 Tax=Acytostelium subglobosum LB1 TaxID=1410327 RepID=UPI000644F068|nr:hypothetical protein SAMD00019534_080380 [Acytostelium subglobosum LB1]GAM24863.1 hypothetical protein SAMD00019534_080380 [Acytostelium subglobosum LB1]|eukprot:XP_012751952.1 hypothetical protein SAMD00019534_080380 [Acytostelium subglobosum LB1]
MQDILNNNNVKEISFIEQDNRGFDEAFWIKNKDFFDEMSARSVEMKYTVSHSITIPIRNVPLTSMTLLIDRAVIQFDYLPKSLNNLSIAIRHRNLVTSLVGLPDGLTSLKFLFAGWSHPIAPGSLPSRLKTLDLGSTYNYPIEVGSLPATLEIVNFGGSFNQPLTNLPRSVTKLHLCAKYKHPIGNNHLEYLDHMGPASFTPGVIFPALTYLNTHSKHDQWPLITSSTFPNLSTIYVYTKSEWSEPLDLSTMASSLRIMFISAKGPISSFPQGLERLQVFSSSLFRLTNHNNNQLPRSLLSLTILEYQYELEAGHFPPTLTSLSMFEHQQLPLKDQLPLLSLKSLSIGLGKEYDIITIGRFESILATTSLESIELVASTRFNLHLYRITDNIFLKHSGSSILFEINEFGFINSNTIMHFLTK